MACQWEEKDLLGWARHTLPEHLLECMRDPVNTGRIVARTPWENLEVDVVEAELDGEIHLCGKKESAFLEFELEVGMRIDIIKRVWYFDEAGGEAVHRWPAIVQIARFEARNEGIELRLGLEEVPEEYADEVTWYLREGLGYQFIWQALSFWRAQASRTWLRQELLVSIDEPVVLAPATPAAFLPEDQLRALRRRRWRQQQQQCGDGPAAATSSLPGEAVYEEEDEEDEEEVWRGCDAGIHEARKAPAAEASRSKGEQMRGGWRPAWLAESSGSGFEGTAGASSSFDGLASRHSEGRGTASSTCHNVHDRAADLCEAIAKLDCMKVFRCLDKDTINFQHPQTGRCAVHWCVIHRSADLLQLVIAARAEVNIKDAAGQTPLMMAAQKGNAELTRVLIDAGADVGERDTKGRFAHELVPEVFQEGQDVRHMIDDSARPHKFGVALLKAIQQKDARTADSAIEAGGDPNAADDKGDTPLILLAKGKWADVLSQVRLAEKMVRTGAAINVQNSQGGSALHFAAHRGNLRLISSLLELRADLTLSNKEGNTALMFAAHGGHEEICTKMLEAYAPAGLKNNFGLSAAQIAAKRGFQSCAVLIQAFELAPKQAGDDQKEFQKEREQTRQSPGSDYSKWNTLERRMAEEEELEERRRREEHLTAMQEPAHRWDEGLANLGPEAFGRPAGSSWPPQERPAQAAARKKGDWDYCRWERIVSEVERRDEVRDRREHLEQHPEYVWRNGTKMRVMF